MHEYYCFSLCVFFVDMPETYFHLYCEHKVHSYIRTFVHLYIYHFHDKFFNIYLWKKIYIYTLFLNFFSFRLTPYCLWWFKGKKLNCNQIETVFIFTFSFYCAFFFSSSTSSFAIRCIVHSHLMSDCCITLLFFFKIVNAIGTMNKCNAPKWMSSSSSLTNGIYHCNESESTLKWCGK